MKILLLGKNGQVGWELQRSLAPLGELIALDRAGKDGLCGDLTDLKGLCRTISIVKPNIIVNAAAYTAVDKAENDKVNTNIVNAQAPRVLAEEALKVGAWLVHYSTDYVFDGSGNNAWEEKDESNPLSEYGRSKLAGEQAIENSGCKYLIFRTSWVFGSRGKNFAKTMLNLANERQTLSVINDQVGAPTSAALLADCTAHALLKAIRNPELAGLYHLAASGQTTWYEYANLVIEHARNIGMELLVTEIKPIGTLEYPTPAKRPYNSMLSTAKFRDSFDLVLPKWQQGVIRMLDEINCN
ncbi:MULTISPECIES: dTDP-4-dehydrorhamnose reductase [unclassified Psychrobacter]|uniref:dTDP-4-dehydrorhamnose reductase n=1 Tax=unclassified Psychrobacter TaxID=196806 RepID=UPI0025EB8B46|nr:MULTISPECIES: dTDP-4-dehydrorhamnose reductase [unclassified Psychrobacter]